MDLNPDKWCSVNGALDVLVRSFSPFTQNLVIELRFKNEVYACLAGCEKLEVKRGCAIASGLKFLSL